MASTMVGYGKPALLPTPTKAGIATATQGQLVLPSSTTQPSHHNRAQADSSKKEKVPITNYLSRKCIVFCFSLFFLKQSDFVFLL